MRTFKSHIQESVGPLQLCGGQKSGCEAMVHAFSSMFEEEDCDAVLLIDADNAFNRINRKMMLHNIRVVCPIIATYVINTYQHEARLFINGGKEILSKEGTTQGDPAAMPVYALGLAPLLDSISTSDTRQGAYADDIGALGKLEHLLMWWNRLVDIGPKAGYYPKPMKSWLVVKPEMEENAKNMFKGTSINVTSNGARHLGATIGTIDYRIGWNNCLCYLR